RLVTVVAEVVARVELAEVETGERAPRLSRQETLPERGVEGHGETIPHGRRHSVSGGRRVSPQRSAKRNTHPTTVATVPSGCGSSNQIPRRKPTFSSMRSEAALR